MSRSWTSRDEDAHIERLQRQGEAERDYERRRNELVTAGYEAEREVMEECEQRCGRKATVYAIDPIPGGWGGRSCDPCAEALRFTIIDQLEGR